MSRHQDGLDGDREKSKACSTQDAGFEAGSETEQTAGEKASQKTVVEVSFAAVGLDVAFDCAEDDADDGEVLSRRPSSRFHLDGDFFHGWHARRIDCVQGVNAGRKQAQHHSHAKTWTKKRSWLRLQESQLRMFAYLQHRSLHIWWDSSQTRPLFAFLVRSSLTMEAC